MEFLDEYRGTLFQGEWPTIPQMFRITCARFPDRRAFTAFEPAPLAFNWSEARAAVQRAAAYLQAQGVRRGDRVALTGKNSAEWTIAYLAALEAGAIVVPLDHQLGAEEMAALIRFAEAKALCADEDKFDALAESGVTIRVSLAPSKPNYILELPAAGTPAGTPGGASGGEPPANWTPRRSCSPPAPRGTPRA